MHAISPVKQYNESDTVYTTRMGETGNAYQILVGRPEGKRPLGSPRCIWVGKVCTGFIWLRTGTTGGLCEHHNEPSSYIKREEGIS
jgi:hypothetical protein